MVDRTLSCATVPSGGVREIELRANTGFRQGRTWQILAFAVVATGEVRSVFTPLDDSLAWVASGKYDHNTNLTPSDGDLLYNATRLGTWALNRTDCKPAQARVPLSAKGLRAAAPDALGVSFDCETPRRVLVRVRMVAHAAPDAVPRERLREDEGVDRARASSRCARRPASSWRSRPSSTPGRRASPSRRAARRTTQRRRAEEALDQHGEGNGGVPPAAAETAARLLANIETVVRGKTDEIKLVLTALVSGGHVLLEDVPGTAKTVLARAIAGSVEGATNQRIQCTPDLQPTDVTGLSVFDQKERDFEFRPGPVFANVVLVDEINRAMPKTQSALLEAMAEQQVTIDGVTRELPDPFLVLATENPIEQEGTFPLPEAQLDRFFLRTALGYPSEDDELTIVEAQRHAHPLTTLRPALGLDEVRTLRRAVEDVYVDDAIRRWTIQFVRATREVEGDRDRRLGARQPRARAGDPRVGAPRRPRLRDAGRRRAALPAGRPAPDRVHAELRRDRARDRLGRGVGEPARAVPRDRAEAGRRARGGGFGMRAAALAVVLVIALAGARAGTSADASATSRLPRCRYLTDRKPIVFTSIGGGVAADEGLRLRDRSARRTRENLAGPRRLRRPARRRALRRRSGRREGDAVAHAYKNANHLRVLVFTGAVANPAPGQDVEIVGQDCGAPGYRLIAATQTTAGGAYQAENPQRNPPAPRRRGRPGSPSAPAGTGA